VRYGLAIGAFFAWPVRILMWVLYPIVFPTAKLLDWILGHENGVIYKRAELKELVKVISGY
jgi:metal transporter CNNM